MPAMKKEKVAPEVAAAISMALHLYFDDTVHDAESFVITIRRDGCSDWNIKGQNFRRKPEMKF